MFPTWAQEFQISPSIREHLAPLEFSGNPSHVGVGVLSHLTILVTEYIKLMWGPTIDVSQRTSHCEYGAERHPFNIYLAP